MNFVQTIRNIYEKLGSMVSLQDIVLLWMRLWVAKIFYTSGRTKVGPPSDDPLISLDESISVMRDLTGSDAAFAPFANALTDDAGYYVSELTEFADQFAPDSGLTEKIEQTFAPTSFDHLMATISPNENAVLLFEDEYQVPLLDPAFAAKMAVLGETFLPILLIFGLGARFGALGLLVMTGVIQMVYPNLFYDHMVWAAALLGVLTLGPGKISLDAVIGPKLK